MKKTKVKNIFLSVGFAILFPLLFSGCGDNPKPETEIKNVTAVSQVGDGFDLKAAIVLSKETLSSGRNTEALETAINAEGGPNNLDLDGDGKIDYIQVEEFGEGGSQGFEFYVQLSDDKEDIQQVATIELEKEGDSYKVQAHGNDYLYGANSYYYDSWGPGVHVGWLWRPHRAYLSPWGYGYYPSIWHPVHVVPLATYRSTRVTTITKRSTTIKKASSPQIQPKAKPRHASSMSKHVRKPSLGNASGTQKGLSKRDSNKAVAKGGFGKNKKVTAATNSAGKPAVSANASGGNKAPIGNVKTQKGLIRRDSNKAVAKGGFGNKPRPAVKKTAPRKPAPKRSHRRRHR